MQIGNGKQGVRFGEYTDQIYSDDENAILGWVEPACKNPKWILWFTKQGDLILYPTREMGGGVIGEPIKVKAT